MNRKVKLYVPNYLESFQCIGGDCSDTCCRGWQVSIDEQTYKKYRKLNTSEFGKRLSKYICKNRQTNQGGAYAYIQLEQGQCPFLTSSCRCEIQEKVGHSYLSKTCQTYPRYLKKIGNNYEMTGVLSCPVIAEQILLADEPFELIEKNTTESEISTYVLSKDMKVDQVSLSVRSWVVDLLQDSHLSLQDRLITLVIIGSQLAMDEPSDIDEFLSQVTAMLKTPEWQQELIQLRNFSNLNHVLKNFIAISKKQINEENNINPFVLILSESLKGVLNRGNFDIVDHIDPLLRIKDLSDNNSVDQILQNYAIHYVMQSGASFSSDEILKNIQQLLIRLSFFRILLAGLVSQCGEINSKQVVQTIQKFTKYYEHSQRFKDSISEIWRDLDEMQVVDYLALIV